MDYRLATESGQLEFLLALGKQLDEWVQPGAPNDFWVEGTPLITTPDITYPVEVRNMARLFRDGRQRKLVDLVLLRIMRIAHGETREECIFQQSPCQRHYSENIGTKNIVLKSGKIGFSALILLRLLLKTMTRSGANALVISYDDESVKKVLFPMAHFALERMPDPIGSILRKGALRTEFSSVDEIYFPVLNSRFRVASAGNKNAGVSSSLQYLHASEVSRWDKHDPKQLVSNLLSHMIGDNREVHFESRPNGDVGVFPEMYWEAKRGMNDFKAHFYEWFWDPMHQHRSDDVFALNNKCNVEQFQLTDDVVDQDGKIVELGEKSRARIYEEKYSQSAGETGLPPKLGKRYFSWYREKKKDLKDKVAQEYAENEVECFRSSGNNPFSATAIQSIALRADKPVRTESAEGKAGEENGVWYWKLPEQGKRYMLFCDTAGGTADSRTSVQILEWETLEQCAEYAGRVSYESQPGLLRNLGHFYNDAMLAVENNHGNATGTIAIGVATYPNVYWHEVGESKVFGWPTNKNRDDMLDHTVEFVRDYHDRIHSVRLAAELKTAETNKDRIQARKGYTFDVVMAFAGALSVRREFGRSIPAWFEVVDLGATAAQKAKKVEGGVDSGWHTTSGGTGSSGFGNTDLGTLGSDGRF